jgi:2-isopropylmalate synthase
MDLPTPALRLIIADTTLRDGEQSPGAAMSPEEKSRVAEILARLNVDIIEAGFPAASPGEYEAVRRIATEVPGVTVSALARCRPDDIDKALQALEPRAPEQSRVHLFLGTSPIHRALKPQLKNNQVLDLAVEAITLARQGGGHVQFSLEDATRTEPDFLDAVIDAVVEAGAQTICLPDTVGSAVPATYARMFLRVARRVPAAIVLAAHCHNDLGLALANSLAACEAGAQQVECTLNGIGERAGNTALEEFIVALKVRFDHYGLATDVMSSQLYAASQFLADITGLHLARNKPIVGRNVFTTAAGIHQDGLLKDKKTYMLFPPELIGATSPPLVMSKHSGRAAVRDWLDKQGISLDEQLFDMFFETFIALADFQKEVSDDELHRVLKDIVNKKALLSDVTCGYES